MIHCRCVMYKALCTWDIKYSAFQKIRVIEVKNYMCCCFAVLSIFMESVTPSFCKVILQQHVRFNFNDNHLALFSHDAVNRKF